MLVQLGDHAAQVGALRPHHYLDGSGDAVQEARERRHQRLLLRLGAKGEVDRGSPAQQHGAVLAKVDDPVGVQVADGQVQRGRQPAGPVAVPARPSWWGGDAFRRGHQPAGRAKVAKRHEREPVQRQPVGTAERQHQAGSQQRADHAGGHGQRDDQPGGQAERPADHRCRRDNPKLPGGQTCQQPVLSVHIGRDTVQPAHRAAPIAPAAPRTIRYTR